MDKNKGIRKKNINKSVKNNSKISDSSSENDSDQSFNATYYTTENLSGLGTDISSLSTSGGSISTSTPILIRNESKFRKRISQTSQISPKSITQIKSHSNSGDSNFPIKYGVIVCLIVALFLYSFVLSENQSNTVTINDSVKINLENSFDELKIKFPLNDEQIWNDLISGILDVIELNRQAIFLLIYSDNKKMIYKLSEEIGKIAAKTIKSDTANITPIILGYDQLNIEPYLSDHGTLITDLRTKLAEQNVLIVNDLQLVNGHVAKAFHTICDSYNPLIQQSVIIFTMHIDDNDVDKNLSGKIMEIAEKHLNQIWSQLLDIDILQALVTRLTVNVLKIQ